MIRSLMSCVNSCRQTSFAWNSLRRTFAIVKGTSGGNAGNSEAKFMKIEVTCSNCQSVLRVASEHSGKQLRCPTCGTLCNIPFSNEIVFDDDQEGVAPDSQPSSERGKPDPNYTPREYIGPQSAPLNPDAPVYHPTLPPEYPRPTQGQQDENLGRSFLMFGLGFISCFVCGCLSFVIAPVLFAKGMKFARKSNPPDSTLPFFLNLAGFVLWAVISAGLLVMALFG